MTYPVIKTEEMPTYSCVQMLSQRGNTILGDIRPFIKDPNSWSFGSFGDWVRIHPSTDFVMLDESQLCCAFIYHF